MSRPLAAALVASALAWGFGLVPFLAARTVFAPTVALWGAVGLTTVSIPAVTWLYMRAVGAKAVPWLLSGALVLLHVPADLLYLRAFAPELLGPEALIPAICVYAQFAALPPITATLLNRSKSTS
jgi:hypothetical protein